MEKYLSLWSAFAVAAALTHAAHAQPFAPEQFKLGADTYARHCAACHGARMKNPEGSFDLPTFPKDGKERFVRSVSKGRNSMPPWEGLLKPEEIEALWAYVHTGDQ
jgi:mono/diheme cytochrome c family protein